MSKYLHDSDSDSDEISNLLECSVCLELCQVPIQQCKNGHNVCTSHVRRLGGLCPVCRVPYSNGSVRNLLAEKLILKKKKIAETQRREGNVVSNKNKPQQIRCKHFLGGACQFKGTQEVVNQHELTCPYRPIRCCLGNDNCFNAEIPFCDYIFHLRHCHKVKTIQGASDVHKYFVNADGKLVRNGSSSVFIMEIFGDKFLVTAKLYDGKIYIWVAIHGLPEDGLKFVATIELIGFPLADDRENKDFCYTGPVKFTTRSNLTEIINSRLTPNLLSIETAKVKVEDGFKPKAGWKWYRTQDRQDQRNYWTATISILKQPQFQEQSANASSIINGIPIVQRALPLPPQLSATQDSIRPTTTIPQISPNAAAGAVPLSYPAVTSREARSSRNLQYSSTNTNHTVTPLQQMSPFARDFYSSGALGTDSILDLVTVQSHTPSITGDSRIILRPTRRALSTTNARAILRPSRLSALNPTSMDF